MKVSASYLAIIVTLSSGTLSQAQFGLRSNSGVGNPFGVGQQVAPAMGSNPYAPVSGAGAMSSSSFPNQYNPYNPNSGFNPYFSSWYPDPIGSYFYGTASILNATGQLINSQEQARGIREQAHAAWLENVKRRFDLERYIRENTPTFTDEQLGYAKVRLRRIQSASNINEITSGTALNVLLDDLKQFRGQVSALQPIKLPADVLRRLNVTGNGGSMGLLRNDGKFTWPLALRQLVPENVQGQIEQQTQVAYVQAMLGKVNPGVLESLKIQLDEIRDKLLASANAVPTSQYLEAKRFLVAFDGARRALQDGDAKTYADYQKLVSTDPNLQQVIDFLLANGLRIAPAVQGDEAAYRAFYDAMAAFDVAYNAGAGSGP